MDRGLGPCTAGPALSSRCAWQRHSGPWRRRCSRLPRSGKSAGQSRLETVPGTSGRACITPCRLGMSADRVLVHALHAKATGLRGDGGSMRRISPCPASRGEGGHSRAGCPGRRDCRHRERSRPHGGCVRPGRPTAGHRGQRVAGVTLARSVRGHRFRASGVLLQTAAPGRPRIIRTAGLSMPRRCRARRGQEHCDHRRSAAAAYAPGRHTTGTEVLDRRRPDARTRTSAERTGAAGHWCWRPVESRTATLRRASDIPSAPHRPSARLVRLLLAPDSRLTAADLVLQHAAARRFCGGDPRGAGRLDRRWELRLGLPLPRRAFTPPPRVDSVVLVARRR